jgi:DNA/RNA endonuclease YhcR with UshA esterase domain
MQKEEKIVVVLLLMALGSLMVASWAFEPDGQGQENSLSFQKDSSQTIEGQISDIKPTKSGGNLILRLDTTSMSIFIPASAGASEISKRVHIGNRVKITGMVSQYQGKEELLVSRSADVQLQEN